MQKKEPPLPDAAFETDAQGEPTERALEAERSWTDDMIIWGRDGWLQVARLCNGALQKLPDNYPKDLCKVPE